MFPDAPYIARPGQINAWDNEDFVKTIKATGRKQLIIAGVVTDICATFPTRRPWLKGLKCSWSRILPAPSTPPCDRLRETA